MGTFYVWDTRRILPSSSTPLHVIINSRARLQIITRLLSSSSSASSQSPPRRQRRRSVKMQRKLGPSIHPSMHCTADYANNEAVRVARPSYCRNVPLNFPNYHTIHILLLSAPVNIVAPTTKTISENLNMPNYKYAPLEGQNFGIHQREF